MPSRGHSGNVTCGRRKVKVNINLKIATWNIRTLQDPDTNNATRPPRRTAIVANELHRYDIDIAALTLLAAPCIKWIQAPGVDPFSRLSFLLIIILRKYYGQSKGNTTNNYF